MKKLLVMIMILSLLSFSVPKKSQAQYTDVMNSVKEYGLDTVAVLVAKTMLKKLTAKTVNWINSGFKGNPGYVQDPQRFFLDMGDDLASQYLSQAGINKLCSPFKAEVRLALTKNYINDDENYSCTLSILKNNYDAFTQDFTQGGWDGWFEITQNTQNNPLGAYLSAKSELAMKIGTEANQQQKELDLSGGFLNLKRCPRGADHVDPVSGKKVCLVKEETVTPGTVINDSLSTALGSGFEKLEAADEINEVITALVMALVDQLAGKASGLFGASESPANAGGTGTVSLAQQIFEETETADVNTGPISATQPSLECSSSGGTAGEGTDTDGDGIIDSFIGGEGGSVSCKTTPGSVTGVPSWPLGGGGGSSCPAYTPDPNIDCTRVDSGAVLSILSRHQPNNSGITAAESEIKSELYPWADLLEHPRLDKFDFGNGMIVDVIIGARPDNALGQGWMWGVECGCNRNPAGQTTAPTAPQLQLPPVPKYTINYNISGLGNISDTINTYISTSTSTTTASKIYSMDYVLSVTAKATTIDSVFLGWGGSCAQFGNQPICTVNVTGNGTIEAIFR